MPKIVKVELLWVEENNYVPFIIYRYRKKLYVEIIHREHVEDGRYYVRQPVSSAYRIGRCSTTNWERRLLANNKKYRIPEELRQEMQATLALESL